MTSTFSLLLNADKPEFTSHPENQTVEEGKNVTLSCNAIGNPVPSLSWTVDGSPVNNPRISLSSDNKLLTITNVNRTDSGHQYRCLADNMVIGTVVSNAATLNVQCKYYLTLFFFYIDATVARWRSIMISEYWNTRCEQLNQTDFIDRLKNVDIANILAIIFIVSIDSCRI